MAIDVTHYGMGEEINTAALLNDIQKGWVPSRYLSNMSMAYFGQPGDWVGAKLFPICPVDLSTGKYHIFNKADLARDNYQRKPAFGKVPPAQFSHTSETYDCKVDQIIVGIDNIQATNYSRSNVPGSIDPRKGKARYIAEQTHLHLDINFAKNYFRKGVWQNEYQGIDSGTTPGAGQFIKFSDANSDPIHRVDEMKKDIKREGRRDVNKIGFGYDTYLALKKHPDILERVKFTGSTLNPARVNQQVLAQLFEVDEVAVFESTYNTAPQGKPAEMDFICETKGMLLCHTTNTPQIDEPSAGYTFTWDMLGTGNWLVTDDFDGEGGTHSSFMEGLMSTDMRKTCDDLACFLYDCV